MVRQSLDHYEKCRHVERRLEDKSYDSFLNHVVCKIDDISDINPRNGTALEQLRQKHCVCPNIYRILCRFISECISEHIKLAMKYLHEVQDKYTQDVKLLWDRFGRVDLSPLDLKDDAVKTGIWFPGRRMVLLICILIPPICNIAKRTIRSF